MAVERERFQVDVLEGGSKKDIFSFYFEPNPTLLSDYYFCL